jgi:hypothetical protein
MNRFPQQLAADIYNCHAELLRANELLERIEEYIKEPKNNPMKDVFGRNHDNLELGIPSSASSRSIVRLSADLGKHIVIAHIANMEAKLKELSIAASVSLTPQPEGATV